MQIKLETKKQSRIRDLMFDKMYLLNLDNRPDRMEWAVKELESIGLHGVHRVSAVNGKALTKIPKHLERFSRGMVGCWLSHKNIIQDAIACQFQRILVLEDDLNFAPGFNEYLELALPKLPADWQFVYLGYTQYEGFQAYKEKVNDCWVIPGKNWGTQAYMINGLDTLKKLDARLNEMTDQIDGQLLKILPIQQLTYYAIYPCMIGQRNLGTDVQTKVQQKIW